MYDPSRQCVSIQFIQWCRVSKVPTLQLCDNITVSVTDSKEIHITFTIMIEV